MEEKEQIEMELKAWFERILEIHKAPTYLLIYVDSNSQLTLKAAASSGEELVFILDKRKELGYIQ